ncbi:MAG: L,D-transpeptidase family protein [Candidatus Eisenbacteria bacterium]|nr:L,D-transpeptidase family protein [Candidatus Eisenbacteria bacterium]
MSRLMPLPSSTPLTFLRFAGLALLLLVSSAQAAPTEEIATELRTLIAGTRHPDLTWPEFPWYQDEMEGIYRPIDYLPFWMSVDGRPKPEVKTVIEVLKGAETRGLPSSDYDVIWLRDRAERIERKERLSPVELARFDAALSLLLMRYISDLHIGRINPRTLSYGIDVEPKKYVLPELIRSMVNEGSIAARVPAQVEPSFPQYDALLGALPVYSRLAARTDLTLKPGAAKLEPGGRSSALPKVRRLLSALGDLPATESSEPGSAGAADSEAGPADSTLYDSTLVAAMKRFQSRHGLEPDGIVGKGTWATLAVPMSKRLRQIELSLERLRWLPEPRQGRPFVIVNIPAFTLWAFDSLSATPSLEMNVIVGKSLDKQTPIFLEEMRYVIFRPYWNVPYKIARDEILPKLRANSGYLDKEDMELVSAKGGTTVSLSGEVYSKIASGEVRIRQRPGPKNSLGLAKFIFPNDQNVYLHGTPSRALFARARRDFSHGCVRVQDPPKLAAFVLKDQPTWTADAIQKAMDGTSETRANLSAPLPVVIFYATAIVSPDGRVQFFDDIYGQDETLDRALRAGEPYLP